MRNLKELIDQTCSFLASGNPPTNRRNEIPFTKNTTPIASRMDGRVVGATLSTQVKAKIDSEPKNLSHKSRGYTEKTTETTIVYWCYLGANGKENGNC